MRASQYHFLSTSRYQSLSATAANSAILCRCGSPISAAPLLQAFCAALPLQSLSATAANSFHNGTKFRNSLPLRIAYFCLPLATGLLCSIASAIPFHNGTIFRDLLPLRNVLFCHTPSEGVVFHCISPTPSKGVTAMKTIQNTYNAQYPVLPLSKESHFLEFLLLLRKE